MIFKNNRTYDVLKWVNAIVIPAVITFILTVAKIVDWKDAVIVGGILNALNTLLGSILGVGNYQYKQTESELSLDDLEVEEESNEEGGNG